MIILEKKRLKFILGVVLVSIFSVGVAYNTKNYDMIETVALPASNKVVVLDAGHGTPDERGRKWKWNNRK